MNEQSPRDKAPATDTEDTSWVDRQGKFHRTDDPAVVDQTSFLASIRRFRNLFI